MNKKRIFIIGFMAIVTLLCAGSSFIFAWFTFQKNTIQISASTTGISFTYSLNDSTKSSDYFYDINNLSFFDPANPDELDDFLSMSCELKIDVVNTSSHSINFIVSQTVPTILTGEYVFCLFTQTRITASTVSSLSDNNSDGVISVADLIPTTNTLSGSLSAYSTVNHDNEFSFYAYVFGVHSSPDLISNDFLNDTFSFAITIKCEQAFSMNNKTSFDLEKEVY